MKISVIQPGARLHYAVPAIFARAGILERLYTDLHADHWFLRAADRLLPSAARPKPLRRLLGRRLPEGLPARLVHDRPVETLLRSLADAAGRPGMGTRHASAQLLHDLESAPLGEGDTVYTVLVNEDVETMQRLKNRGVRIIHECMLAPDVARILAEEHTLFPGFGAGPVLAKAEEGRRRDRQKYDLADQILVPSRFVSDQVREASADTSKVRLVPYGLDTQRIDPQTCRPVAGRVLFVGSVGLRKGSHYLAEAARALPSADVHVVGPLPDGGLNRSELAGPTYHGQVPRSEVFKHYRRADVFVLPTLCEGMALVHLEAMAHGLPVVTTPNCGSVVRDGIDGFVVPARDAAALAERIREITEDRALRDRMSRNARERAKEFSMEAYARRLLDAVQEG